MTSPIGLLLEVIKSAVSNETRDPTVLQDESKYADDKQILTKESLKLKWRQEKNEQQRQNRVERKKYAWHIFVLTCIWAGLIFIIIIADGLNLPKVSEYYNFKLSDKVLITLISSTTINFFGFFFLVVKYLFDTGRSDKKKKNKRDKNKIPQIPTKGKVKTPTKANDKT